MQRLLISAGVVALLVSVDVWAGGPPPHPQPLSPGGARGETGEPKGKAEAEKLPRRAVTRLGNTAFAQEEVIFAVALSPDGKKAATAGSGEFISDDDGGGQWNYDRLVIRIWDVPEGQTSRQIPVPEGPVLTLDYSPDGKSLAASAGKKVIIWDADTGKETQRMRFDAYPVQVRYTPDGKHLLINLLSKEVVQWDVAKREEKVLWTNKKVPEDHVVADLDWSPDGTRLALLIGKEPVAEPGKRPVPIPPHRVEVLDLPGGKPLFTAEKTAISFCVALAPDNKTVAFGRERLGFWDVADNKKRRELAAVPRPIPPGVDERDWGAQRSAHLLTYSPDGKFLAAVYRPGLVSLWKVDTGAKVADFVHSFQRPLDHASDVIAFSRDSKRMALGGASVLRLVDTATGKEISSWPGHRLPMRSLRFSPDGQRLFTYNHSEICAWQAGTWQQLYRHDLVPMQKKYLLNYSHETNLAITFDKGDYILEDLPTGKKIAKIPVKNPKFEDAQFSFEGKSCCLYYHDEEKGDFSAMFYSLPDCKELFPLTLKNVERGYFSPIQNSFTWITNDGVRFEADGLTGKITKDLDLGTKTFDPDGPPPITLGTIYSWDGKYLLNQSVDKKGQSVRIWDMDAGRTIHRLHFPLKRFISGIDFTFDSRLMVYTQGGRNGVCVLELSSGKERRSLLYGGQTNPSRVVTSPTDFVVAAGLPGNTVMVWDLARTSTKTDKTRLTDQELDALWTSLAADSVLNAELAIETLVQFPAQAVPFLKGRLKPIVPPDQKELQRQIANLSSADADTRDKAVADLEDNLELAQAALRKVLDTEKPSAEMRKQVKQLLGKPLPTPDNNLLRDLRAIEALERIGTPAARAAIEPMARGAAGSRITQDAAASLKRLARKK